MRTRLAAVIAVALSPLACAEAVPEAPCPGALGADGLCRLACATDGDCLLSERCEDGACRTLAAPRPAITSFTGPDGPVPAGSEAELAFRTAFATEVRLRPEGGEARILDDLEGIARTGPLSTSGTWVLVAESPTGRAEARVRVEVSAVDRPEVVVRRFEASPARVPPGAEIQIEWAVDDAEGPIRIVAGDEVVVAAGAETGAVSWRVDRTTAFALSAPGFPRPALASATVVVDTVDPGAIIDFAAIPAGASAPLLRRRGVLLRWETEGGAALELAEGNRALATLSAPDRVARGAWLVAPPAGAETVYRARLVDGSAEPPVREARVRVAAEVAPPVIARFEVSPDRLPDSGPASVSLRWEVMGSPTEVRIDTPGGSASVAVAAQGQRTVNVRADRTARFRLRAENPGGLVEARRVVWHLIDEGEPNQRPDDARELDDEGAEGVVRSLGAASDVDWFEVEAEDGGRLDARLLPPCERGLRLAVFDPTRALLGEQTAQGGNCPRVVLSPSRGSYLLRVDRPGFDLRAPYAVVADAAGPTCGDGVRSGDEACDDGNRAPGDGCSQACTREPGWSYRVERREPSGASSPDGSGLALSPYTPGGDARDDGFAVVDLETWTFPFFGEAHAGFAVHTNGFISFFPDHAAPGAALDAPSGAGAPNAWIAPFLADLRLGPSGRLAIRRGVADGEPTVDVIFEGLEAKAAPGSRLGATVSLLRSGEIRITYPRAAISGAESVQVAAGIESPRGAVRASPAGCPEAGCVPTALVGATHVFR